MMDFRDVMLLTVLVSFFVFVMYLLCGFTRMLDEREKKQRKGTTKEVIRMSERSRTPEEYIQRHATQYHNGDTERAKEDAIVKETLPTLEVE